MSQASLSDEVSRTDLQEKAKRNQVYQPVTGDDSEIQEATPVDVRASFNAPHLPSTSNEITFLKTQS